MIIASFSFPTGTSVLFVTDLGIILLLGSSNNHGTISQQAFLKYILLFLQIGTTHALGFLAFALPFAILAALFLTFAAAAP